jgi:hypothetical protein
MKEAAKKRCSGLSGLQSEAELRGISWESQLGQV